MYRPIRLLALVAAIFLHLSLSAQGGMWLPLLLQDLNEEEMQDLGMKITAKDIYDINTESLKDAIVHFGGFCTGEVISSDGLVLTNHHCGYGQIQNHSTLEDNILENGFFAKSLAQEKPNPGLYVEFIERIDDVTADVLNGVKPKMSEEERRRRIQANSERLRNEVVLGDFEKLVIKPFYGGNQYFAFRTKRYPDVRLVAAPPNAIGKFGADTDNWEWPRHTGDFSLFRIYTAPDGSPAEYSPTNVPMRPKKHLEISIAGVKEGDFSMIFGFPGRTDQYLPAAAMAQRTQTINPIRIGMRDLSLAVIDSAMRADAQTKIDYASKQARIANAWKKWRGESEGVAATDGLATRASLEYEFNKRLKQPATKLTSAQRLDYAQLLPKLGERYRELQPLAEANAYAGEVNYNVDLFRLANIIARQLKTYDNSGAEAFAERSGRLADYLTGFYERYNPDIDRKVATALVGKYLAEVPTAYTSDYVRRVAADAGSVAALMKDVYRYSLLTRGDSLVSLLRRDPGAFADQLRSDFGFQFVRQFNDTNERLVVGPYNELQEKIAPLQRNYMQALMQVFPERKFYPDANSTLRVTYGQFGGFTGLDGKEYDHQTFLDGAVAKYRPGDYEFDMPDRLLELHKRKAYGRYADENGKLPVCLLGSNHTTGGNSGSPALDADGRLVGLNFDRTWQSTMSDVNYDPSICRNIMVDIRYVLWLLDTYGQAPQLLENMTIVE